MSALIQKYKDSDLPHKETAWALFVELEKDRENAIKKINERYDELRGKYHGYWCSKAGGIVPEQKCGYCGEHTYDDHPKDGKNSVSRFGLRCHKRSVSLQILELAHYNNTRMWDNFYGYNTKDFLDTIHGYFDRSKDGYHLEFEFTKEEIEIIFNNQVKHGRICFCNNGKPTLTEKGRMILERTPWSGMATKGETSQ